AFGSENLAPITDGLAADTFVPAVGQTITISPVAVDPETGRSVFDHQTYDFGDGVIVRDIAGATTHSYATPGIYCVRCTLADDQGLTAIAEDQVIVGATQILKLPFKFRKYIPPEEAGSGEHESDTLATTFIGVGAKAGDRIVFVYNRNRFGRMHASDAGDDTDIILKPNGSFTGATRLAHAVSLHISGDKLAIRVSNASLDRTGDPRFGRADIKGIFKQQRIAVCIVPADGSTPRVWAFTGNMQVKVKGGATNQAYFCPEESISGTTTDKEPDPRKQEVY
ncbi:MAG: PKD domain-containing protein, partial [Planctomycetota bacterium]